MNSVIKSQINNGLVIPASPLALSSERKLDERRQRALWRYYSASGAGGIAIGVHTTQFAIRNPENGLYKPLLALGKDEMDRLDKIRQNPLVRIAGVCGNTEMAIEEAEYAKSLGYHCALLNLNAFNNKPEELKVQHCKVISEIMPIFGFYLQASTGGAKLSYNFWKNFAEIENVAAVKLAPFNRYHTVDAMRAIAESGREDIAMYTGNDDNIIIDLLTPFSFWVNGKKCERRMVGGLLGHWSAWTSKAVQMLDKCHEAVKTDCISKELMKLSIEVTDCNAAFFDTENGFNGCIAGMHEVLRRQGFFDGIYLLNSENTLSPGQKEEIDRVYNAYPHLNDDSFVKENLESWLSD